MQTHIGVKAMDAAEQVLKALVNIGGLKSVHIVAALLLSGTLTMAIIQILKDLCPIRRAFQRSWIEGWLRQQALGFSQSKATSAESGKSPAAAASAANAVAAETVLLGLATGGDEHAFHDLSAEQLVAQMSAAAQITLDYPRSYGALVEILSAGADPADIAIVCGVASARSIVTEGGKLPPNYTDARARVGHRIQRNLDGLQISMSDRWQLWLQWAALIVSVIIVEIAILLEPGTRGDLPVSLGIGLLVGIIGGYLAPVVRDVTAALQSLRNP
jgi:hypothetical protein